VIFTAADAQSCGTFQPGTGEDAELTVCPGDEAEIGASATDECSEPTVTLEDTSPGAPTCEGNPCWVAFPDPGVFTYTWSAEDEAGNTTTCLSTVTVLDFDDPGCQNSAPSCDTGGPYGSTCRMAELDSATATDPDSDTVTYAWTSSDPDVAVFPESGTLPGGSPDPLPIPASTAALQDTQLPCAHDAVLTLAVDDGSDSSACETTVTFDDSLPPEITAYFEEEDVADEDEDEDSYGLYTVRFWATDSCDPDAAAQGYLDVYGSEEDCGQDPGLPVEDGDQVFLQCSEDVDCDSDENGDEPDGVMVISGPGLILYVTAADHCTNTSSAEAIIECDVSDDE
jgi:hypothetical protein